MTSLRFILAALLALGWGVPALHASEPTAVPAAAPLQDGAQGGDEVGHEPASHEPVVHEAAEYGEAGSDAHAGSGSDSDDHGDAADRSGDPGVFMELFAHLTPHAVSAVWVGGSKGFGLVSPYAANAAGEPAHLDHYGHAVNFHDPDEFSAYYSAEFDGGWGFMIYNINTVMWIAGLLLFLVFVPFGRRARALKGQAPRGAVYGMLESTVLYVRDEMVYALMGKHHGQRFVPLFLTMFFFILFMNILGLMNLGPVGGTATANLAVTGGLALVTLTWIHLSGLRSHGPVKHWANFVPAGIPWFTLPIIIPVEIIGMIVKPVALTIRLFANMTAGHLIVLALFGLIVFFGNLLLAVPFFGLAVFIYALELFVCFVQAYIFTYLSILFIGASVHPDH
ncbi:MAG: ATP synthase F0 subunit A [Planctomycetota bacterium]|nr:MAG: ATP synthase F0 subunit A [Planctomycetota bacterium]